MFIRYNNTAKYWEYDTSAAQSGAGPWLILELTGYPAGSLPANVAYRNIDNNFSVGQNITGDSNVIGILTVSSAVRGGTVESRGNFAPLMSFDINGPINNRGWWFRQANTGIFYLETINDSGNPVTQAARFDRNGIVTFASNYTAHHGGAYFPTLSSNPGLLDKYEEGDWIPTFQGEVGTATGQTYNIQNGRYTRIGRYVHCNFGLGLTNIGTGGSGNLVIRGLPFINDSVTAGSILIGYFAGIASLNIIGVYSLIGASLSFSYLYYKLSAGAAVDGLLNYTNVQNGTVMYGSISYIAG